MHKANSKSIKSIFLRSQVLVSIAVLGIVTSILAVLLLALSNFADHRHIVELGRSLENYARLASQPEFLQHALIQQTSGSQAINIAIISKNKNTIIAAASNTTSTDNRQRQWLVSDPNVRQLVAQKLAKGEFGIHFNTANGRRIAILPLAPEFKTTGNNNVILGTKWPTPAWHSKLEIPKLSLTSFRKRIEGIFLPHHHHTILLNPDQYAGAIVIEASRDWIADLLTKALLFIAALMTLSITVFSLGLTRAVRKNILRPIDCYLKVFAARKSGDHDARVPLSNITEFDELAKQWNSLLEFRDVAQGQNMVLSTLLEHVPVGIDVTDSESLVEYANPSFLEMTGYTLAEVIGKAPEKLLASYKMDHDKLGDALVAITNGQTWTGEVIYTRKDGSDLVCATTFVPVFDRKGKIDRIITVRLDITRLKDDEKKLIAAKIKAEMADRSKSEFLANMSHELRTPLNAMIGFSEMMAAQKLGPLGNDQYVEFAGLIEKSSRNLLTSINLILDMSRLESGQVKFDKTTFCASELTHKIIDSKEDNAREMGVSLHRHLSCKHDIYTDERILRQVIGNLLCNAIRYNKEGGKVDVTITDENDHVTITIRDTGKGIAHENLSRITEPFFRVDNGLAREKDGTGLGLSLVKQYTDELGIDFRITSQLGKGTVVFLKLPVAKKEIHYSKPDNAVA